MNYRDATILRQVFRLKLLLDSRAVRKSISDKRPHSKLLHDHRSASCMVNVRMCQQQEVKGGIEVRPPVEEVGQIGTKDLSTVKCWIRLLFATCIDQDRAAGELREHCRALPNVDEVQPHFCCSVR